MFLQLLLVLANDAQDRLRTSDAQDRFRFAVDSQLEAVVGEAAASGLTDKEAVVAADPDAAANATCWEPLPGGLFGNATESGGYNKFVLVLVEGSFLGLIGLDRLYLGQPWTAVLKGLTFGGFGAMFFVDYFSVMANAAALDEGIPGSFYAQTLTVECNATAPALEYLSSCEPVSHAHWSDCNLLFARYAALASTLGGAALLYKGGWHVFNKLFDAMRSAADNAKALV